jgi:hypothetical protein
VLGHSKISAFALRMEAASFYFFKKIKDIAYSLVLAFGEKSKQAP